MIRWKPYLMVFFIALFLFPLPVVAKAESNDIQKIDDFETLKGDSKYLAEKYRDNYYLDIEKTGILDSGDKIINGIANILFWVVKQGAYIVTSIFYYVMSFDVGALLSKQISSIQNALRTSIFVPLFGVAFAGTSFIIIKRMIKRDMIGIGTEVLKVIGIFVFSMLIVSDSGRMLSYATNLTKQISKEALTSIKDAKVEGESKQKAKSQSMTSYAATASGAIWETLVHNPWKTMEFGTSSYKETDVEAFLTTEPGTEERETLVEDFDKKCFDKTKGSERVGFLIIFLIPFFINCGVYLMVSGIQLMFQILAVVYVMLAPIVLILALLPGYESSIPSWLRKFLETQISILIITFLMGLLIKMNTLLYDLTPTYGWLIVLIFQTTISMGLVLKRNEILQMFGNMQKGVSRASYARAQMIKSGNLYQSFENIKNRRTSKPRK